MTAASRAVGRAIRAIPGSLAAPGQMKGKRLPPTALEAVQSFPYAFLVDRKGTVVWEGHPEDNDSIPSPR